MKCIRINYEPPYYERREDEKENRYSKNYYPFKLFISDLLYATSVPPATAALYEAVIIAVHVVPAAPPAIVS